MRSTSRELSAHRICGRICPRLRKNANHAPNICRDLANVLNRAGIDFRSHFAIGAQGVGKLHLAGCSALRLE
jgi:hypothetical protein